MKKLLLILLCLPMIGFGQKIVRDYHINGQIYIEEKYDDNGYVQEHRSWYNNGQIQSESFHKNGKPIKASRTWYENGQLSQELLYLEDTLVSKSWYENGQLQQEANFIDGLQEGLSKSYHENGQLSSEGIYKNGEIEGVWKFYYENGQIRLEKSEKNESYYEKQWLLDGTLISFKCDTLEKGWYDNGKLLYECNFSHPKGNIVGYDSKGTTAYNINYILAHDYRSDKKMSAFLEHYNIRWPNSGHWRTNAAINRTYINLIDKIEIFHAEWKDNEGWVVKTPKILYYEAFFKDTEKDYDISGWEKYFYDNGQIRKHEIFESGESVYKKEWFKDGKIKSEIIIE